MTIFRMRNTLMQMKFHFKLILNFYKEAKVLFSLLIKHNASIHTNKNVKKMQYTLLRENHVIEKGMSMKNPKNGFGKEKVKNLLKGLNLYYNGYNDKKFLIYPLSTIRSYIEFTKHNRIDLHDIIENYENLYRKINSCDFQVNAGVKEVSKFEILEKSNINFSDFVNSRHSIRYFSNEVPDIKLINEALVMAQQTPSACNRQAWHVHVFSNERTSELLKWQGGANGFENDVPLSLLITSNLNAFLFYEPYQAYVDGGLYAMSLIYALHSLGLGTIPLSTGFQAEKIKKMHNLFNIPANEIPIVIIGVGHLLDHFKVAISERKSIQQTTTYNLDKKNYHENSNH